MNKSISSKLILKINRDFVNKLYDYRSTSIHKKTYKVPVDFSKKIGTQVNHEINAYCPPSLISKFKELKEINKGNDKITLVYTLLWLGENTLKYLEFLLLELRKDLEKYRRIDPENEPIKFKK